MSRLVCSGLLLCGALACSSSDDPKPGQPAAAAERSRAARVLARPLLVVWWGPRWSGQRRIGYGRWRSFRSWARRLGPGRLRRDAGASTGSGGIGGSGGAVSTATPSARCTKMTPRRDRLRVGSTGAGWKLSGLQQAHVVVHNDTTYNNTDGRMHGWPCFANAAISDFFAKQ